MEPVSVGIAVTCGVTYITSKVVVAYRKAKAKPQTPKDAAINAGWEGAGKVSITTIAAIVAHEVIKEGAKEGAKMVLGIPPGITA